MAIDLKQSSPLSMDSKMTLKIAVVVHGRFHAFDLVRELIKQGCNVTLFTNYPKHIVEQFGIPQKYVRSFVLHGLVSRLLTRIHGILKFVDFEPFTHSWFSIWATRKILKEDYDIVHAFSGIAEELFRALANRGTIKILVRGSTHIRTQFQLLSEEENRANSCIDKPSLWIIDREEREYQLADKIVVLSSFAKQSFINQHIDPQRISVFPLGAQLDKFRPDESVIKVRHDRILSHQPFRVLMVGTFSYRKGAIDFVEIVKECNPKITFRFVGDVPPEASALAKQNDKTIEFIARVHQYTLPQHYAWADLFIFTTIEDGFPVVLSQAQASGLPILTTPNCSSPDIIVEGETGWIVPIRNPEAFITRLQWCDQHRKELAQIAQQVYYNYIPRDWKEVANDFLELCRG